MKTRLEIYLNHKKVVPDATMEEESQLSAYLAVHKEIDRLVDDYRRTGNKLDKVDLPAIMFMGVTNGARRCGKNCIPTGLASVDIDKMTVDAREFWNGLDTELLKALKIRCAYITTSGKGLRIVAECMKGKGVKGTIAEIAERLNLKAVGEIDEGAMNIDRLSALVPAGDWLYMDGLFNDVPDDVVTELRESRELWESTAADEVGVAIADVRESDEEFADFEYNGFKVREIAEKFVEKTGGDPPAGQRHTFYNKLVKCFRCICDNDPKIVHAVLPKFGHGDAETYSQCVSICKSNRSTRIEPDLYVFLKEYNFLAPRRMQKNVQEETEDETEAESEKMAIPNLPPIFKEYVAAAPDDFKFPTFIALLPVLGTLTSYVRAEYFDGQMQSTEFFSCIFAPPASGKSYTRRIVKLLDGIKDRDKIASAKEELWAMEEKVKGNADKGKQRPRVSVRVVKPIISVPELLTKMRDNKGHHMFIESEELDTFRKGSKSGGGGDKSDMWRIAWDNGSYGQQYMSVSTFKGEVDLYLNLLFTCTFDQVGRFFKNVTDGLVTRFSICPIDNQKFAKFQPWKKFNKQQQIRIDTTLARLDAKTYKSPLGFNVDDVYDVPKEEFDSTVPWQYEFQPIQEIDMSFMFKPLLNWLEEKRLVALQNVNEAMDVWRRRVALKAFRYALLAYELYPKVTKKEEQDIIQSAIWFANEELKKCMEVFESRYNEEANSETVPKASKKDKVLVELGNTFTKNELRALLKKYAVYTPARKILSLWRLNYLIKDTETKDVYQKTLSR